MNNPEPFSQLPSLVSRFGVYDRDNGMSAGELWRDVVVMATVVLVTVGWFGTVSSVYLPENSSRSSSSIPSNAGSKQVRSQAISRPKTNSLEDAFYKRRSPIFKSDKVRALICLYPCVCLLAYLYVYSCVRGSRTLPPGTIPPGLSHRRKMKITLLK